MVCLDTGVVQIRDAATGALRAKVGPLGHSVEGRGTLAVSPDGRSIAIIVSTGSVDSAVDLISLATGKVTSTFAVASSQVESVAFSPDGKTLAIAAYKNLLLLDLTTQTSVKRAIVKSCGSSLFFEPRVEGGEVLVGEALRCLDVVE